MDRPQSRNILDFIFYIDKYTFRCYTSTISSFSPFILNLINNNQYWYYFQSLKDPNCVFEDFIKLISGFEIDISIKNVVLLNEVSKILQVEPLFKETDNYLKSISKTPETIINLLTNYCQHGIECPEIVEEVVTKWEEYKTILTRNKENEVSTSKDVYEYIFSQDKFQQKYSETLFDTIIKLIEENGQTYSSLFSYCDLSKLTSSQFDKILQLSSYDSIPHSILILIKNRFNHDKFSQNDSISTETINTNDANSDSNYIFSVNDTKPVVDEEEQTLLSKGTQTFKFYNNYDEDWMFRGIFYYIRTYPKHIFNKYVNLSCGGDKQDFLDTLFQYEEIQSFHWDNYSKSEPKLDFKNAWITVSFPCHKVKLNDYTLIASTKFKSRPKSWVLLGKNDQDDGWQKIDEKNNGPNTGFAKKNCLTTPVYPKIAYSQFKLQFFDNLGNKRGGSNQEVALCGIEFYGTISLK